MKVDDDMPLSSLASAVKTKLPGGGNKARELVLNADDETPLFSLATAASKTKPSSATRVRPKVEPKSGEPRTGAAKAGAVKPKPKVAPKRKTGSSSSSSGSYSYSSSSDSEDAKPKKKRPASGKAKARARAKAPKAKVAKKEKPADGEEKDDSGGAVKKKERTTKEDVVAQLLCRWWYSDYYQKNDWPPKDDAFYQSRLKENKLRQVRVEEWEWLPDVDDQGLRKVYELSQFRGMFRNTSGELIDLRPKDTMPCVNNFMKKDMTTLCQLLLSAYENQLKDLKNCRYNNETLDQNLKASIVKIRDLESKAVRLK